jgi:hypothetical protein
MISPLVSSSTICRRLVLSAGLPDTGFLFAGAGNQALALRPLTRSADCFYFFSRRFLGWFFVESSTLHLAEDAFPLHLPFSTLRAWSTLLLRTNTCKRCFPLLVSKRGTYRPDSCTLYCMRAIDSLQVRLDMGQIFDLGQLSELG